MADVHMLAVEAMKAKGAADAAALAEAYQKKYGGAYECVSPRARKRERAGACCIPDFALSLLIISLLR